MGFGVIVATMVATLTAKVLKYDVNFTNKGLYGFNAALVGVAIMLFFKPVMISWLLLILGSVLSTVLHHVFMKYNLPLFTFPFVVVTWLIFYSANYFLPELKLESINNQLVVNDFAYVFRGFGQVIFQDKILSGILFFIAVFISMPIAALYGLFGGVITALLALVFDIPTDSIANGLWSYNAVLCAIAFAGNSFKDSIWVLSSVLLSFLISMLLYNLMILPLTFPFVLASFMISLIKRKVTI
ncbi:urea transporter [Paludibacter sp.]